MADKQSGKMAPAVPMSACPLITTGWVVKKAVASTASAISPMPMSSRPRFWRRRSMRAPAGVWASTWAMLPAPRAEPIWAGPQCTLACRNSAM